MSSSVVLGPCFKLYSSDVNGSAHALEPWEVESYFGTAAERLHPEQFRPMLETFLNLGTRSTTITSFLSSSP